MNNVIKGLIGILFAGALLVGGGIGGCAVFNQVRVYNAEAQGRAVLAEAESSRRVAVLEATAKKDSAASYAEAEVIRAKGVAAANDIIMNRLGGPQNYLAYLQIDAMNSSQNATVIYVPTEAGLPITEAGRRPRPAQ